MSVRAAISLALPSSHAWEKKRLSSACLGEARGRGGVGMDGVAQPAWWRLPALCESAWAGMVFLLCLVRIFLVAHFIFF